MRVPGPRPRPTPRRAVLVLWGAGAVGGLAQSLAGTAGALLAAQVSGSDAVAGLPQAALVTGSAAAALGLSAIARRHGRGTSLATGAAVAAAGCGVVLGGAVSGSLAVVLVGSVLLGAGNTAVMLARYAAADLVAESARPQAMAGVLLATTVGAVLGPHLLAPAGRLAAALGLPVLAGPYLLAGAAFAAATLVLAVGLRTAGRPAVADPAPVPAAPGRPGRDAAVGLLVLGTANLVMVAVMTMAPVQLHHLGHGLPAIGVVVSLHVAAMFAPSPVSGWLTGRVGARRAAAASGGTLAAASALAAARADSLSGLAAAMVLLGAGWNLGLISGSVLLTAGVPPADRPRREGWGEVGTGLAAAGGGVAAGPLVASGGYASLAGAGALTATLLLALAARRSPAVPAR